MGSLVETWLLPFISILFIVDPLGATPAFMLMTSTDPPELRRALALKASIACALILMLFATAGGLIFKIFGITFPAFRIAGGIVLGITALEMLRADRSTRETREEVQEGMEKPDIAITPLALPILSGPGAISTVMVFMNEATSWTESLPIYLAILATGCVTYFFLRMSEHVHRILGRTGINVFSRLMGLVLATVAVQFILDGLRESGFITK